MRFAVVDVETTGGRAGPDRITEIGIVLMDDTQIVQEFQTLIDPECSIPPFIQQLTGITNNMVRGAPVFSKIAHQVLDLLKGAVFVAHNVSFDWSFIRKELEMCGIFLECPRLCTVRLSRKYFPGHPSYSLQQIAPIMGFQNWNHHRALGDAQASAHLLKCVIECAGMDVMEVLVWGGGTPRKMLPGWDYGKIKHIPQQAGVLWILGSKHQVLYVCAAKHLREKALSLLSDVGKRSTLGKVREGVVEVDFEVTGSELLARLKVQAEVIQCRPVCNRELRIPSDSGPPIADGCFSDVGRTESEKTWILLERGRILGYCWADLHEPMSWNDLRARIVPIKGAESLSSMLRSELRRRPSAMTRKPETEG